MLTLKRLVHSKSFHVITTAMIVGCSVLLGLETYFPKDQPIPFLIFLDWVFALFFLVEIVLRMMAADSLRIFFRLIEFSTTADGKRTWSFVEEGLWNVFDTLVVIASSISLFAHWFEHPELLAIARLFRVFRILRLLEVSKEMKQVEMKIISIIPTVFSFGLLLGALIYIYAIVGVFLFEHHTYDKADFSDLQHACLTLFQCMTLEGWVDIMYQAAAQTNGSWFIKGYFISFIILTVIVSFNVFVAVLTSQVQEKISEENQKEDILLAKKISEQVIASQQILQEQIKSLQNQIQILSEQLENIKKDGGTT